MFGDIGHGFLMALSALAFIMIEKKYPRGFGEEITDTFFFGRYIILLMGLFAMVRRLPLLTG
jgi:V-type H+-transporting ATPase subunit a